MKVEWFREDIKPGRIVGIQGIAEQQRIGYLTWLDSGGKRYVVVSMTDGAVSAPMTKDSLAKFLTDGRYLPVEILS